MPKNRKHRLISLLKGLLVSIFSTLLAMLLIAAAVTWLNMPDSRIRICNQVVKIAAIILGTCAAVRRGGENGLIAGTLIALAYMALGYALYIWLGGGSFSTTAMLGEMLIGSAAGALTGTIRANMRSVKHRS